MVTTAAGRRAAALISAMLAMGVAAPAAAQTANLNQGNITLTGGLDFANAYMFRGLRQDDTRVILWPWVDAAVRVHSGQGGVRTMAVHVGTWNSLHTGSAGLAGPSGKLWYESDFYTTLQLGLAQGLAVGTTFTAYTSPNNAFSTVKELSVKVSSPDAVGLALNPHALVAFELDTAPGVGQADGGAGGGTYLEIGVAPGWAGSGVSLTIPIRVGLSLDDYYELAGVDHKFGFLSLGAMATVPIGGVTSYGAWNLHGGFEFQSLGDTPEAFNGGDQSKIVGVIGVGFSY